MTITLTQSGGLLPITKEADAEVDWSEDECDELLKEVAVPGQKSSATRDGIYYTLNINDKEVAVDPENATGKYAEVLSQLKKDLKIVKT